MSKSPLRHHIRRSKHNILPSTFPGPFRNTTTLLRLPRCLHHMKHCLFYRIIYFTNSCSHHDLYNLRGLCFKTRSNISIVCFNKFRMTSWLPSTISHIRGPGEPDSETQVRCLTTSSSAISRAGLLLCAHPRSALSLVLPKCGLGLVVLSCALSLVFLQCGLGRVVL